MNFIVFDLEATCWETDRDRQGRVQEIIEIGALKIDEDGDVIGKFMEFVRPTVHPQLSSFCQKLTSISQVQINQARPFDEVVEKFQDWIGLDEGEEYLLCSWGFFDQKMLSKNCQLLDLEDAWTKPHISLKHQYPRIKGLRIAVGLRNAVEREGFEFEGTHHRGIDDAINLSKVFIKYLNQWQY